MKRIHFLFVFALLLIPTLVSAKIVTCTSNSKYYIGQDVYNHTSVECSEGSVEVFAVGKNESTSYLVGGTAEAIAQQGESYWMDIVLTGEIDPDNGDLLVVDGDDQTDMALYGNCDTGCHLITKAIASESNPNANTGSEDEKEIAVGTIYYVGDKIKFNEILIILFADSDGYFLEVDEGSYKLPSPSFTDWSGNDLWEFENFIKEYGEPGLDGLRFGYTTEVSADRVPIGIKCVSGVGTVDNPFTFELVYEDTNTNPTGNEPDPSNNDESSTTIYTILEGADQTYTKGSNTNIVIKASGDLSKLVAIEIDNGNVISSSNYELADGSTILTLLASFLENSSIGEHTITFRYNDGDVSTNLMIAEATNNNPTTPTSNNTDNTNNTNNPQTADNIEFYIMMLGLGIIAIGGVGIYTKRKFFS